MFLEDKLDILSYESFIRFDGICFTSNGVIKANGELVMGKGVAYDFKVRFPSLPRDAALLVRECGNVPHIIRYHSGISKGRLSFGQKFRTALISFPTKDHFKDASNINLIRKSAIILMNIIEENKFKSVALPAPGCGNGGLVWSVVKDSLKDIFDERVVIVKNE